MNHYNEFLAINYNVQLLEKFIYFYYQVNVVRKGSDNLSDYIQKGRSGGAIRLRGWMNLHDILGL
jgi:hypothetical protein